MHDLVIRSGTIVDGTGEESFVGDVAIDGGTITLVGEVSAQGREEIDATGKVVTPGFVDVHTHYDGQATWDDEMAPSSWHGVTTVIMGNCGVGFAPAKPDRHDWLIGLMEGVEDIPGTALAEGMSWNWAARWAVLATACSKWHPISTRNGTNLAGWVTSVAKPACL